MTDLSKANGFPLLKDSIDLLLLLPHYLDIIEDFIHLSFSCKTLHNIYTEHPPLPGLLFEPKPHFLIAGVARQIGEWAVQTAENRIEFHESFRTEGIFGLFELCKKRGKLTLDEICDLIDRKSTLRSLVSVHWQRMNRIVNSEHIAMLPYLQIAMFGGLFAASVRNFCEPGVTNPLHISIRLDCWDIIDAQPSWMGGLQMYDIMKVLQITATLRTSTFISLMKQIPDCFVTSVQNCRDISYDDTYHDRNFAFSAFIYLQGWDSLDLMYQVEVGTTSLNAQAAIEAAMIAFRMENSQVTNFKIIRDDMIEDIMQDLGTVVDIELDTYFVCDRALLRNMLYSQVSL
ncbi:uncharacterized protein Bfra_005761 [Botrytis fragariae]|uniref:Uncharacterized protein n=1 Tax=Botrytis fragariae TaxID=1964551 RepID=A0A8H6EHF7_9HELO|nr:uncharacterized protein Bfra_005761 [Botrytis fragariae]KAF5872402.1 hypothetical protein Bfra_005761 [Botrytis fragariae]